MTDKARELFDKKGQIVKRMEDIGRAVKEGKQDKLTYEQRTQLKDLNEQIKELDEQIGDQDLLEQAGVARSMVGARQVSADVDQRSQEDKDEEKRNVNFDFQIYKKAGVKHGPITEWRLRNFDVNEKMQRANVYQVLAAMHPMADHKTFSEATKYALDECRAASASAMLTEFLSSQIIDGGLSKSRLSEAGMQVQVMEEPTKRFAKITGYPTFNWTAAGDQTSDKTVTFSSVDFEAKTLRGFVTINAEQAQDCHNLDAALRTVFQRSIGNSVDYAGLFGAADSATEPEGIYNYDDVNRIDYSALLDSYDPFLAAARLILDDNGEIPRYSIISPGTWELLNTLKQGGTNSPLPMPLYMGLQNGTRGHQFLETTMVPDDLDEQAYKTCIFTGDFSTVNLGVRLGTQVIVTPLTADRYQASYLTVLRADIQAYRQEDVAVIDNVWLSDET